MRIKNLTGDNVLVLPETEPDEKKTASGLIIPKTVKDHNYHLQSGVVIAKGKGTPWNDLSDIKVKDRVFYGKGAGKAIKLPTDEGRETEYLILKYTELLFV